MVRFERKKENGGKAEVQLTDAIKAEIEFFINAMENERMDTKAIGVKNADK